MCKNTNDKHRFQTTGTSLKNAPRKAWRGRCAVSEIVQNALRSTKKSFRNLPKNFQKISLCLSKVTLVSLVRLLPDSMLHNVMLMSAVIQH